MSTSCDPKPFTFLQVGFSYTTRITLYIGRLCMGMQQLSLPYPALHIITTWPGEGIPPDPLALVFTSARGGKRAEKGWKHAWTEAIVKPRLAHCVSERVNGNVRLGISAVKARCMFGGSTRFTSTAANNFTSDGFLPLPCCTSPVGSPVDRASYYYCSYSCRMSSAI